MSGGTARRATSSRSGGGRVVSGEGARSRNDLLRWQSPSTPRIGSSEYQPPREAPRASSHRWWVRVARGLLSGLILSGCLVQAGGASVGGEPAGSELQARVTSPGVSSSQGCSPSQATATPRTEAGRAGNDAVTASSCPCNRKQTRPSGVGSTSRTAGESSGRGEAPALSPVKLVCVESSMALGLVALGKEGAGRVGGVGRDGEGTSVYVGGTVALGTGPDGAAQSGQAIPSSPPVPSTNGSGSRPEARATDGPGGTSARSSGVGSTGSEARGNGDVGGISLRDVGVAAVLGGLCVFGWAVYAATRYGLWFRRYWGGFGGGSTGWDLSPALVALIAASLLVLVGVAINAEDGGSRSLVAGTSESPAGVGSERGHGSTPVPDATAAPGSTGMPGATAAPRPSLAPAATAGASGSRGAPHLPAVAENSTPAPQQSMRK